jgi:MFS family permease
MLLSVPWLLAGGDTSVTLNPDTSQLPGAQTIQDLANGIAGWALIAAVLGLVVGSILWAFGHYSQNYQQAYNGRRGVIVSAVAGVLIGAAPHVIDFFFHSGHGVSTT